MKSTDIRVSHPYFRVKRGLLTVFVDASSNDTVLTTKRRLVSILKEHGGGDSDLMDVSEDSVRLLADVSPQQTSDAQPMDSACAQYRVLDDSAKIGAANLADDQIIYFVLRLANGNVLSTANVLL
ncbi:hypothetical protein FB639_004069 [Coemansia asiatica]|nr:hypothetical protein FB639_004069 [Coemansia asiatica]